MPLPVSNLCRSLHGRGNIVARINYPQYCVSTNISGRFWGIHSVYTCIAFILFVITLEIDLNKLTVTTIIVFILRIISNVNCNRVLVKFLSHNVVRDHYKYYINENNWFLDNAKNRLFCLNTDHYGILFLYSFRQSEPSSDGCPSSSASGYTGLWLTIVVVIVCVFLTQRSQTDIHR